ncbi:MAG: hypothetical protein ACI9QQ_002719 [Myxococcota bacterium]|jgi:hypothetical protein
MAASGTALRSTTERHSMAGGASRSNQIRQRFVDRLTQESGIPANGVLPAPLLTTVGTLRVPTVAGKRVTLLVVVRAGAR